MEHFYKFSLFILIVCGGVVITMYPPFTPEDGAAIQLQKVKDGVAEITAGSTNREPAAVGQIQSKIFLMYTIDQYVRNQLLPYRTDQRIQEYVRGLDAMHTECLKNLVVEHGWFLQSRFGSETAQQAWLLVQHADHDLLFQEQVLTLLDALSDSGEVDKAHHAYLYDRVALHSPRYEGKQRYGTQVDINGTFVTLKPYEGTLEELNQRRTDVGLEPIEEYLASVRRVYRIT